MIQPNELRIGNWIYFTGNGKLNPCPIVELYKKECLVEYVGNEMGLFYNDNEIEPIPLTHDILVKCGFEKQGVVDKYYNHKIDWAYYINNGELFIGCDNENGYEVPIKIKGLHQLQNLYFALTNQELQVNL